MEEYFVIDNREVWRKQPYISLEMRRGYTWDLLKAVRLTRDQINEAWGDAEAAGRMADKTREKLFVPCDVVERLSFPAPADGDAYPGHGPVILRHPAIIEQLRKASVRPEAVS